MRGCEHVPGNTACLVAHVGEGQCISCAECGEFVRPDLFPQPEQAPEQTANIAERYVDLEKEAGIAIRALTEAIHYTAEYLGPVVLPPQIGWAWYDVLTQYAPHLAKQHDGRRYCCVINCPNGAEFQINNGTFEDDTDACTSHVGELLGYREASDSKFQWVVTSL